MDSKIPDADGSFYELKDVPHGNVLVANYFSATINAWRHIFVYTPPGYEAKHFDTIPSAVSSARRWGG